MRPVVLLSWPVGAAVLGAQCIHHTPAVELLEGTVLLVPPGACFSHFCLSFWCHSTGVHTEWLALPSLHATQGYLRKSKRVLERNKLL